MDNQTRKRPGRKKDPLRRDRFHNFRTHLEAHLSALGYTPYTLATQLGLQASSVYNWFSKSLTDNTLHSIAGIKELKLTYEQLNAWRALDLVDTPSILLAAQTIAGQEWKALDEYTQVAIMNMASQLIDQGIVPVETSGPLRIQVPIIGTLAPPLLTLEDNSLGHAPWHGSSPPPAGVVAFKISGDGLAPFIPDGSLLYAERHRAAPSPHHYYLTVMDNGDATLQRIDLLENGKWRLTPVTPSQKPTTVAKERVRQLWRVIRYEVVLPE